MSHQIPASPPPTGPAHFLIQTNSGSVSVSGAFSLLGVSPITTFVSGSATIFISGTGGSGSSLTFDADSGSASAVGGILNIATDHGFIHSTASGNTVTIHSDVVSVPYGGTGVSDFSPPNGVLYGRGTNSVGFTFAGVNGQVLLSALGNPPKFGFITSSAHTLTFSYGPWGLNIEVVNGGGLTVLANQGSATPIGNMLSILGSGLILTVGTTSILNIQLNTNNSFFNPLKVRYGGTGRTVLTTSGVLLGEGSNDVNVTDPGTDGQVLIASSVGDPVFGTIVSLGGTLTFSVGNNFLSIDVNASDFTYFNPLPVPYGGTGLTVLTSFGVLIGEGQNNVDVTDPGTDGQVLLAASGADPVFGTITSSGGTLTFFFGPNSMNIDVAIDGFTIPTPLPVNMGGTGLTLLTAFGVLIGEGQNNLDVTAPGTDGQMLLAATGGDPAFGTITSSGGSLTFVFGPNSINIEVASSGFTLPNPLPVTMGGTGLTLLTSFGVLIGEGQNNLDVTAPGTDGQMLLAATGGDPAFGTITSSGGSLTFVFGPNSINVEVAISGFTIPNPIPVMMGGTGLTLLTSFGVLIGEGQNNLDVTAPGTDGQVLLAATGGDPAFGTITSSSLTFTFGPNTLNIEVPALAGFTFPNPLPVTMGGTGQTLLTAFGVLVGEGSNNVNVTAAGTNGQMLIASTVGDPKFATLTSSSGTLSFSFGANSVNIEVNAVGFTFANPWPVTDGGTGRTLLTTYGVLVGEGSNNVNVTAAGTNGQMLIASTVGDPKFATLTSSSGTLSFSFGANSINIEVNAVGFTFANPWPVTDGGTGRTILTTYGVLVGEGSNNVNVTAAGTNGQMLIASTVGDPKFATLTSSSGTLSFSFGANSINIEVNAVGFTFANPWPVTDGGTGRTLLTTYGVLVGEGSNNVNVTAAGTNGQMLLGSSTGDPAFATITSTGGTLTFTFGPNSLNIDVPALAGFTFAIPLSVGSGGTGQTLLTTYGILIGEGSNNVNVTAAGTNGQMLLGSSTGDPAFGTITSTGGTLTFTFGPNSINIDVPALAGFTFAIPLPVGSGGTGQTLLTTYGVLLGEGSNNVNVTAAGTNGQMLLGSSTGDPAFGTITSTGGTLSFTFGPNSLNIDVASPGGFRWSTISTSITLQPGNGYLCIGSNPLTFALPPAPVIGTEVALALSGATSWEIDLSGSEEIRFGYLTTSVGVGGGLQSSSQGDVVFLVCFDAGSPQWLVVDSIGNIQIF